MGCVKCGCEPARIVVDGIGALCGEHSLEWMHQDMAETKEARIQRVMNALDGVLDEPIGDDWNNHLRKLAVRAVEAAEL